MPITQIINGFECRLAEKAGCGGCPLNASMTGTSCVTPVGHPCTSAAFDAGLPEYWAYHWFSPVVYELNKE